jgi:hypothetical protein
MQVIEEKESAGRKKKLQKTESLEPEEERRPRMTADQCLVWPKHSQNQ